MKTTMMTMMDPKTLLMALQMKTMTRTLVSRILKMTQTMVLRTLNVIMMQTMVLRTLNAIMMQTMALWILKMIMDAQILLRQGRSALIVILILLSLILTNFTKPSR